MKGEELLSVTLGPLVLKNPVITASGTFGYGVEYADLCDISRLGGISVKGISLAPRAGNEPPRICETPAGMLNAIGLANVGFTAFVEEKLPRLRELGATVIVNIYGTSREEFAELARRFDKVEGIAALELNISCPNVAEGGMHFGARPEPAAAATRAVRQDTSLPLIVKLSPEAADLVAVAQAVAEAGADALSLINTIRGMAIDVETGRPKLASVFGGLSGPAIRPIAVRMVYEVCRVVDLPVIGLGGISTLRDMLEFFLAGASAVQVGTANYTDPTTACRLVDELAHYLKKRDLRLGELIGKTRAIAG
jgi:dihydroorotate dehydrogenase (NAD+) catalytic subunit